MQVETNKKLLWTGRVVTALACAPFLMGLAMMAGPHAQEMAEGMAKYGWQPSGLKTILALEAVSVALYLIPQTAVFGAVLLTAYLGGAVATHLRVGEAPTMAVAVGVLAWVGLYLREPRLRAISPIRR